MCLLDSDCEFELKIGIFNVPINISLEMITIITVLLLIFIVPMQYL